MIENIFSKQSPTSNPTSHITIDFRERNSLVPAELHAQNLKLEYKQLPVGDYIIGDTIIERKEINDLCYSIKNQRLFKQLQEIKQYSNYLLIIEGDIYTQKILHPNSLRGAILSAAISYKIPIIFTRHSKETAQYITILANKKENNFTLTPTKKEFPTNCWQLNILQGFPNIGQVTAKKLLKEFKTLKNIFNISKEKLKLTLGKKHEKIYNIINTQYKE